MTSISTLVFGFFLHPHIQFIWSFLGAFLTGFLAYLLYESQQPLRQVIHYLEQRMIDLRYGLKFQQLPAYLPIQAQPILVISRLKQYFPLFNRGDKSMKSPITPLQHGMMVKLNIKSWYLNINTSVKCLFFRMAILIKKS